MTDTAPELKPCPFCGGTLQPLPPGMVGQPRWTHHADACPISGHILGGHDFLAAWNNRAEVDALVAEARAEGARMMREVAAIMTQNCRPTPKEECLCRDAVDYIRALDPAQFIDP